MMNNLANQLSDISLKTEWMDISEIIENACQVMPEGHIMLAPKFTLLEAMTAVEIMHPKMDVGMEVARYDYDKVKSHEPNEQELCDILYLLLLLQTSWMSGKNLGQTLLTCYYMHDLNNKSLIVNDIVKATWCSVYQIIDLVVNCGLLFEEDLICNTFGIDLDISGTENVIAKLHKLIETSSGLLKDLLEFKKDFILLLRDRTLESCENCEKLLTKISSTYKTKILTIDDVYGFEFAAIKRLSTYFPVQKISLITHDNAFNYLNNFLNIYTFSIEKTLPKNMFHLLASMRSFNEKDPCIIVRAVHYNLLICNNEIYGKLIWEDFIRNSIQAYTGCTYFKKDKNTGAPVITMIKEILHELIRILHFNRGRLLRKLKRWFLNVDSVQAEAEALDQLLESRSGQKKNAFYISVWVYQLKVLMMEEVIRLGFKSELFLLCDYTAQYWYHDYLINILLQNCGRVSTSSTRITSKLEPSPFEAWLYVKQELCRGLFRFLMSLEKDKFLNYTEGEMNQAALRFKSRFNCFNDIGSPIPADFDTFTKYSTSPLSVEVLYKSASQCFESAKYYCNYLLNEMISEKDLSNLNILKKDLETELLKYQKVIFGNLVSLKVLATKRDSYKSQETQVVLNHSFNKQFPIVSVKVLQ